MKLGWPNVVFTTEYLKCHCLLLAVVLRHGDYTTVAQDEDLLAGPSTAGVL